MKMNALTCDVSRRAESKIFLLISEHHRIDHSDFKILEISGRMTYMYLTAFKLSNMQKSIQVSYFIFIFL